jgi:hypothetical protein
VRGAVVWLDMKATDDQGELDSERVIAAGLAYQTELGLKDDRGNVVAKIVGNGPDPEGDRFPEGHEHAGYMIPAPDYKLDAIDGIGIGISPWEHSNGFRDRFHVSVEGYFYPYGKINGEDVDFGTDVIRVGKAKPRPGRQHEARA